MSDVREGKQRDRLGIQVEFLGHPANTFKSLAILALSTGAPVIPACTWREPDGTHVLRFEDPLPLIECEDTNEAIRRNNLNAGGGYIQRNGELRVIRGVGLIDSLKYLEEVVLATTDGGTPIYVRDVGTVRFAPMRRQGAATRDGRGEAVTAIVYLLAGENGRVVVDRIKRKVEEIQGELPEGVVIDGRTVRVQ